MSTNALVPARQILTSAEESNRHNGHENAGFLSESHGFMPVTPPQLHLPQSHRAWDEVAAQLPNLYRVLGVRRTLDALPLLSAHADHLPDHYLLRASAMLSILAHAYVRTGPDNSNVLPDVIREPWETVTRRLGRRAPVLSYIDLIVYNWRLLDRHADDPLRVTNMRLLLPTVGNREEQIFHLTQVEMLAQCTPILGAVVRAQEATVTDDRHALKRELVTITERLYAITHGSFMQINPNPYSDSYVDPVIWAKTVAPFAVPIHEGVQGPSGTSSPIFHLLDIFFARVAYRSILGQETIHLRTWYPLHWRTFLEAVEQVPVGRYVEAQADRELTGLYQEALNAYAGEDGFLGRHRLKVYGYLELAFKVGRTVTIGGFSGLFKDRTWDVVDDALEASRLEREQRSLTGWHHVVVQEEGAADGQQGSAHHVVLDLSGSGIRYQPGDRCCILPENSHELVARTLRALRANGDEVVLLNQVWQRALMLRKGYEEATQLPLQKLLRFGHIRPLERDVAKLLYRITANATLAQIVEARAEDQWELWDLFDLLADSGFDPKFLWQAHPGDRESICWVVPPEKYRMYSIASMTDSQSHTPELHLTAGHLRYETAETQVSHYASRNGTASTFLGRIAKAEPGAPQHLTLKIVRPPRFHLPMDAARPVVLFAGGTGFAPFRGFINQRLHQTDAAPTWLFFAARKPDELPFQNELAQPARTGQLQLTMAFSQAQETLEPASDGSCFHTVPSQPSRIDTRMLAAENSQQLYHYLLGNAFFYICGRAEFARTVVTTLQAIVRRYTAGSESEKAETAWRLLYRLVAEDRLMQEVYTTYTGSYGDENVRFDVSEIVLHNNDEEGDWLVLNGRVYDLSNFIHMHPGGTKILRGYTGMDGTAAYRKVLHHARPEIDSQLALYEIGVIRRLHFGSVGGVVLGSDRPRYVRLADAYRQWVRYLYLVVEMENALRNDFSIQHGALTEPERAQDVSPYKLNLMVQVHRRFLTNYMRSLSGEDFAELWTITVGLCARGEDIRWLAHTLETIWQSDEARIVEERTKQVETVAQDVHKAEPEQLMRLLRSLEVEDRGFLQRLKLQLRQGVRVFEQYEETTLVEGQRPLLEAIKLLPDLYAGYFTRVAKILSAVNLENLPP